MKRLLLILCTTVMLSSCSPMVYYGARTRGNTRMHYNRYEGCNNQPKAPQKRYRKAIGIY